MRSQATETGRPAAPRDEGFVIVAELTAAQWRELVQLLSRHGYRLGPGRWGDVRRLLPKAPDVPSAN